MSKSVSHRGFAQCRASGIVPGATLAPLIRAVLPATRLPHYRAISPRGDHPLSHGSLALWFVCFFVDLQLSSQLYPVADHPNHIGVLGSGTVICHCCFWPPASSLRSHITEGRKDTTTRLRTLSGIVLGLIFNFQFTVIRRITRNCN